MKNYLLGIDCGGTTTKVVLFSVEGVLVATAGRPVVTSSPHPGWSERDAARLWFDTAEMIREVLSSSGVSAAAVSAVACSGHGNGLYLADDVGNPVRPAINSNDQRAKEIVKQWCEDGTGARAMRWTAQRLWAAQPPPLLAWLRDHEPGTLARARWALQAKDFVRFQLTGRAATDVTDSSGTSLLDVHEGKWSEDLLDCLGLSAMRTLLPGLLLPHSVAGTVTSRAASLTGLREGTPVAGGMFDIDACCLASGVVDSSVVAMVAGTWGNCLSVSPHPVCSADILMTSCFAIPGSYLLLEGSPTSAGNLDWALSRFQITNYAEAERLASNAPIEPANPFFLPFLYGSHGTGDESACFLGIHAATTTGQLIRAVYESAAFALRYHLEKLEPFRGAKPRAVRLSGGAVRSAFWCQLFADTLNLPVEIPEGEELGAKGAAMAAAISIGLYKDWPEAIEGMVTTARTFLPRQSEALLLAERFQRYRALLGSLAPVWPLLGHS